MISWLYNKGIDEKRKEIEKLEFIKIKNSDILKVVPCQGWKDNSASKVLALHMDNLGWIDHPLWSLEHCP